MSLAIIFFFYSKEQKIDRNQKMENALKEARFEIMQSFFNYLLGFCLLFPASVEGYQQRWDNNSKLYLSSNTQSKTRMATNPVVILAPKNQATIRNNQGDIALELQTAQPLANNQFIQLVLDGEKLMPQKELQIILKNIDRGSHQLQVLLLEGNQVLYRSKQITIYLHRATKIKPSKP